MSQMAYRYEDHRTCSCDEFDNVSRGPMQLHLRMYPVLRTTAKGFWIRYGYDERWVSNVGKKRFACLDQKEALAGFRKRKERQIAILSARLDDAKAALELAK